MNGGGNAVYDRTGEHTFCLNLVLKVLMLFLNAFCLNVDDIDLLIKAKDAIKNAKLTARSQLADVTNTATKIVMIEMKMRSRR